MARSSYVYIFQHNDGTIFAAKTVKYELFAFVNNFGWSRALMEQNCRVIRMPDGAIQSEPYTYDWSEIPEE